MQKPNKLIHETSPYLLQHAYNPIEWYPWCKEAFDEAKTKDKLIFLSIGYASCHWCHVMEKESFNNPEVAERLNHFFVCVKVDREELPDVDSLYMDFAQMMIASGAGWPLNLILTPELKPFYAVTYMPPFNQGGMMGLVEMSNYIHHLWKSAEKEKILAQAEEVFFLFNKIHMDLLQQGDIPDESIVHKIATTVLASADKAYGARAKEPKFPYSYQIEFLLRYDEYYKSTEAKEFALLTLDRMGEGGIYDHVEGGFSRYCIDDKWMIPHFEKMLSENGLIIAAFLNGFKFTKKNVYQQIVTETLHYILDKFVSEEGGLYSSIDADSLGQEGFYYTFLYQDLLKIFDQKELEFVEEYFNVTNEGNFDGRNVLYLTSFIDEFAKKSRQDLADANDLLTQVKHKLKLLRKKNQEPKIDQKIVTSSNALMIVTLLEAGLLFKIERFVLAAKSALNFILDHLKDGEILYRCYAEGKRKYEGCLDDYAFLLYTLLRFYHFGKGRAYLEKALELSSSILKRFSSEFSGFYFSSEPISLDFPRKIEYQDGAEPSANSILIQAFLDLHHITREKVYLDSVEKIIRGGQKIANNHPLNFVFYGMSLMSYLGKRYVLVIALDSEKTSQQEVIDWLSFLPYYKICCIWKYLEDREFHDEKTLIEDQTTFYLCSKNYCYPPFVHFEEIKKIISPL